MKNPEETMKLFTKEMIEGAIELPPFIETRIIYNADGSSQLTISFAGLCLVETEPKNLDHAFETAREEIRKVLLQMTPSINDNRGRVVAAPLAALRGDD